MSPPAALSPFLTALPSVQGDRRLFPCMNPLHGRTAMCYASESRLHALKMVPKTPCRTEPTGPQYFTFDPLPEVESSPAHRSLAKTNRIKRRSRRVLYPPVVKRYYPAEERSYAKRLLFILLTIVFIQIYTAEEDVLIMDVSPSPEGNGLSCSMEVSESLLLQEPIAEGLFSEITDMANDTAWYWEDEDMTDSTVDITQFLEHSLAAF